MRTLAMMAVIVLGCAATCLSFAQAVAEGAMLHSNSAAATTKMGTALGNTLSNVVGRNAEKMGALSAGKVELVPHALPNISKSAKGQEIPLVITSIRGENRPCNSIQRSVPGTRNFSDRLNTKADDSGHREMVLGTPSTQDCRYPKAVPRPSKSVVKLSFPN
jgi:hypothetical protein